MKTTQRITMAALALAAAGTFGVSLVTAQQANDPAKMTFFVTSVGSGRGGDYGGITGADNHCAALAQAAGSPKTRTWRAYLSTAAINGEQAVNARDRIGTGPWYNAKGVEIAANLDDLHNPANAKWTADTALTEKGVKNPGRGDSVNEHDILTGSDAQGRLAATPAPAVAAGATQGSPPAPAPRNVTCDNWTSSATGGVVAMLGHSDKVGASSQSFNSAHASRACSQDALVQTGGAGKLYCFATN